MFVTVCWWGPPLAITSIYFFLSNMFPDMEPGKSVGMANFWPVYLNPAESGQVPAGYANGEPRSREKTSPNRCGGGPTKQWALIHLPFIYGPEKRDDVIASTPLAPFIGCIQRKRVSALDNPLIGE